MPKRTAQGSGSLRQRPDGRWEARFTYKDELGATKRGSVYGDSQKETRQKLTAVLKSIDEGTYFHGEKRYTVAEWLDEWLETYCLGLKPSTRAGYKDKINDRIKPYIGSLRLTEVTNVCIQKFYNGMEKGMKGRKPLSPKSIQNYHGILHKAMEQAVYAHLIPVNPCDHVKLPKIKKPELKPIMDDNLPRFLEAVKGDPFERLYVVDLFSGLRQSEILGLQWEDVDFEAGTIRVRRQLQKDYDGSGYIVLDETKNGKDRIAAIAPSIVWVLRQQRAKQNEWKLAAGELWRNDQNLVFTDELGNHLTHHTVYRHFKKIVEKIGLPESRFHDLRHSYAINALQAGDTIKDVQEQLGHYSSAFTMDVYAARSDTMKKASQDRMEKLFQDASNL